MTAAAVVDKKITREEMRTLHWTNADVHTGRIKETSVVSCRVNRVFTLLAGRLGGSRSLGGGCRGYKHHIGRNEIVVWDERGCSHRKK